MRVVISEMVTIRDVAKDARVSIATVSAVMNDNKYVSDELKARVWKSIHKLQYRRNRLARNLATQRSHTLAYLIPCVTNQIFAQTLRGVQDAAWRSQYDVVLYNTDFKVDKYVHYVNSLIDGRVDGIIMSAVHHQQIYDLVDHVKSEGIPIVIVHSPQNIVDVDTILVDETAGAYMATKYLVDTGNTSIGFVGVQNSTAANIRLDGYRQVLEESGLGFTSELIEMQPRYSREAGFIGAKRLLARRPDIHAIFTCADIVSVGCIAALQELGLEVGKDISVVGFDDSLAGLSAQQLTTVHIPAYDMGAMAGRLLLQRIEEAHSESGNPRTELVCAKVSPNLKVRDTTRKSESF
jgi:DNA-binding LacI/PurR family transcriptional regulator